MTDTRNDYYSTIHNINKDARKAGTESHEEVDAQSLLVSIQGCSDPVSTNQGDAQEARKNSSSADPTYARSHRGSTTSSPNTHISIRRPSTYTHSLKDHPDPNRRTSISSPPIPVLNFDERSYLTTPPPISTTAVDTTSVTTTSAAILGLPILSPPLHSNSVHLPSSSPDARSLSINQTVMNGGDNGRDVPMIAAADDGSIFLDPTVGDGVLPARAPRITTPRATSHSRRMSRTVSKDNSEEGTAPMGRIGVCALDVKARSRPSRQILKRLQEGDEYEVIVFGDKAILDEEVENWPVCDYLISFFSEGFPLDKAIRYTKLRKPFLVNDLQMQKILWDRRICLMILDSLKVPTPRRLLVTRDGGPKFESPELAKHVRDHSGVVLQGGRDGVGGGAPNTKQVELIENGDALMIDGEIIRKPFVEKPVSGEDHNVIIYFPTGWERPGEPGGARRLFRKIGNKSSEFDKDLIEPRSITEPTESFLYEQFLLVENAEDVKAYTVGANYCHAETRKSPVVDGLVRRNTHGKELRYVTRLNDVEQKAAARIARGFGQRICGFDLLRANDKSYVIDVNGWSFVKDNEDYYNDCARILKAMFSQHRFEKQQNDSQRSSQDLSHDSISATRRTHAHPPNHHRNALKGLFKSPSLSKLHGHIPHRHHHDSANASPNMPASPSEPDLTMQVFANDQPSTLANPQVLLPTDIPVPPSYSHESTLSEQQISGDAIKQELEAPLPSSKHSWKLKGMVAVIRHADRTPKQKIKFTAHSQAFVDLLKGHHEEVLLKGEAALQSVQAAIRTAMSEKTEDKEKLRNLQNALNRKVGQPDTKIQIKPMFKRRKVEENSLLVTTDSIPEDAALQNCATRKHERQDSSSLPGAADASPMARTVTRSDSVSGGMFSRYTAQEDDLVLDKMQLVMKWGGEPTHSARYQSADLGTNMRDDVKLLNRDVLNDIHVFTSSEKRVKTSAQIWASAFMDQPDISEDRIQVRKDLLDDSNAAKDVMDKVKKKLKHLLRQGNSVPEQFAWPKDVPEPYLVMQNVVDLLKFHRKVMRHNFKRLQGGAAASLAALSTSPDSQASDSLEYEDINKIQSRWCTGEDAELFKERWEKLFKEFCDTEKADPSKVSELYDTMKYDALHNKNFLEWVFTPTQATIDEFYKEEGISLTGDATDPVAEIQEDISSPPKHRDSTISFASTQAESGRSHSLSQRFGLRRMSVLLKPPSTPPLMSYEQDASYFKLFPGTGASRSKQDSKLGRLRELYRYAKILFDYIGPQEYGISDEEKLEIGLLTSLPLLREIVQDLEELQGSNNPASFIYFTKESHIYTLLNCIMEGGIHTKIKRATIPELDYLSQICFELYEAKDSETSETSYSIRIAISPGCHTVDPLDVSLDSKHAIGTAQRRSLTNHQDYKEVIATLKDKFKTVQLPKSFLAVNVSDKHEQEARRMSQLAEGSKGEGQNGDGHVVAEEERDGSRSENNEQGGMQTALHV